MKKILLGLLAATTLASAATAGSITIYDRGGFDVASVASGLAADLGEVSLVHDKFGMGWCSPNINKEVVTTPLNISNGGQIKYTSPNQFVVSTGATLAGYNMQPFTVNPDDNIILVFKGTIFKAFLDYYEGSAGSAVYDTCR